jgi:hypothetical protein
MKLLREPLLHFVLLGAALFVLYGRVAGGGSRAPAEIVVSADRVGGLAEGFRSVWQRPPTRAELERLVEDHVMEEALAREALALGLERDDAVIRRRLRQKLEFLAEDLADPRPPGNAELADTLARHADAFRVGAQLSFEHVFVSPARRGDDAPAEAGRLLDRLAAGAEADALGDSLPLERAYAGISRREVAARFGDDFAARLAALEPGRWLGPVESSFGLHLVRVSARGEGRLPALAEIREAVERVWRDERRAEAKAAYLRELRGRYAVRVEWP